MIYTILSLYKSDKLNYVQEAVSSLLNQSYLKYKIYIIFDGPISIEISNYLYGLAKCNDSIIVFERKQNRGLAISLNELLEKILLKQDCKYIARMDADDISLPLRFEKQIAFLETHNDVDCVGTWAIEIKSDGSEYYRKEMPQTHEGCLELFKKRDCLIHPSVMFRKSYFEKAGLYPVDTYFGEDTIMWAQGFKAGCKFSNIPEYLFKFRLDDDFFDRRRGVRHAKSIISLRRRVNKMLGFGVKEYLYSYLYAIAKLMPTSVLNLIYKTFR